MNRMLPWLSVLVLATSWSCSKGEQDPTSPKDSVSAPAAKQAKGSELSKVLSQIPADTPYAFVSTEPMPAKILDKILKVFEPVRGELEKELAKELATPAPTDDPGEQVARALAEEFSGKLNKAGFAALGISTSPRWAIYGIGLMPTFRISLADPAKFKAMIERVEKKVGEKAPVKKVGDQEYWTVSENKLTIAAAVVGSELIFMVTPDALAAKTLPIAFGQAKPAKSLASAGTIDSLKKAHGYKAVGIGFIDLMGITNVVLGQTGGLNVETITAMGEALPPMSKICKTEISGMVAKAPRFSFGYTEISDTKWVSKGNLALEAKLAGSLKNIVAPVAGLGDATPALMKVGIGLDLGKAVEFVRKQLASMAAAPFKCELLAELNQGVMEGNANFGAAAAQLPPFLMGVKGGNLVLQDGDFVNKDPSKFKGHVILTVDQPDQMITMLKGTVPPLRNLNVAPDGKPVKVALPAGEMPPGLDPYIVMSKTGLGIAVGKGEEAKMAKLISAKGSNSTFFAIGSDIGRFLSLANSEMGMVPGQAQANNPGDQLTKALSEVFGFTYYEAKFTKNGLDLTQTVHLK